MALGAVVVDARRSPRPRRPRAGTARRDRDSRAPSRSRSPALTFATLAGGRVRPLVPSRGRLPSAARLSVHFAGRAAFEEALWRGLALGSLAAAFGPAAGLVLSTGGFAASHVATQGRLAAAHLVTGSAFGTTYLVTGHLLAAVLAHAAYNALVTFAVVAHATCPFRPIVGRAPPLYDRPTKGSRDASRPIDAAPGRARRRREAARADAGARRRRPRAARRRGAGAARAERRRQDDCRQAPARPPPSRCRQSRRSSAAIPPSPARACRSARPRRTSPSHRRCGSPRSSRSSRRISRTTLAADVLLEAVRAGAASATAGGWALGRRAAPARACARLRRRAACGVPRRADHRARRRGTPCRLGRTSGTSPMPAARSC